MFVERHAGFGIIFIGRHVPGQRVKNSAANGDSVTLKVQDERVLVRDIVATSAGRYTGAIYGFEQSCAPQHGLLSVGQFVEFTESQIFGCHSA